MSEIRSWKVTSNSFRPDYDISGQSLFEALDAGFSVICADALPKHGDWKVARATGEWQSDILARKGGLELVIHAVSDNGTGATSESFPIWISAKRSDVPGHYTWLPVRGTVEV